MIRAGEVRSDIATIEKLNAAVETFRTKYNCLPGDYSANATEFFPGLRNGNGDGIINGGIRSYNQSVLELFIRWNGTGFPRGSSFYTHLAAAGLVLVQVLGSLRLRRSARRRLRWLTAARRFRS